MRKHFKSSKPVKLKGPKKPWSKKKKIWVFSGIALGVLALAVGGFFIWKTFFAEKKVEEPAKEPEVVKYYSPLTGIETSEANSKKPVLAVMIENSPEARPQSGLADAGVVFEAVAEGGITRFVALYQEAQPELLGPIRSVRPYFVEWASAFDPAIAHVGGSETALAMTRSGDFGVDIDQYANEGSYWRTNDRYAPHNMYSNMETLSKLMSAKNKTTSKFTAWPRKDGKKVEKPSKSEGEKTEDSEEEKVTFANTIVMPVSTGAFLVSYDYNPENNTYTRYQGGEAHVDREKGQIAPNVVIAIMVNMNLSADGLHNEISTTGTGKAYIFQNGIVEEATWSRDNATAQLKFVDKEGEQIEINRGKTWITAVPNGQSVTWQ